MKSPAGSGPHGAYVVTSPPEIPRHGILSIRYIICVIVSTKKQKFKGVQLITANEELSGYDLQLSWLYVHYN